MTLCIQNSCLCSLDYAKIIQKKKIQSTINVGKNKSVVQDSYAYLLTCHCNLISVKKLKSPEITATFDNLSNTVIAF